MGVDDFVLIREKEILEKLLISRKTLTRWIQAGAFPAPIRLGARSKAWVRKDFETWLVEKYATRSA